MIGRRDLLPGAKRTVTMKKFGFQLLVQQKVSSRAQQKKSEKFHLITLYKRECVIILQPNELGSFSVINVKKHTSEKENAKHETETIE